MLKRVNPSRGFSLVELLVVVAIIGIMSLIGVPAFMNYQKSQSFKNSMRQFTSDVRAARQRAVSRTSWVRITDIANLGPTAQQQGAYELEESTDRGATWNPLPRGQKRLERRTKFADASVGQTIVFLPNGTVQLPVGTYSVAVDLECQDTIAKPQYTVTVAITGKVSAN